MTWKTCWRTVHVGEHVITGSMSDKNKQQGERKEERKIKYTFNSWQNPYKTN